MNVSLDELYLILFTCCLPASIPIPQSFCHKIKPRIDASYTSHREENTKIEEDKKGRIENQLLLYFKRTSQASEQLSKNHCRLRERDAGPPTWCLGRVPMMSLQEGAQKEKKKMLSFPLLLLFLEVFNYGVQKSHRREHTLCPNPGSLTSPRV